ncbi:MAG: helix-turn-helix transcriptional regulator [Candidatus Dormibacteraeota bacterium]|nr:helix-turn-helix transcriptional regulator [Candidatus Dormibacteraeota bacterium]
MALKELPVRQRGACCELTVPIRPDQAADMAELLKALADPTRLSMVACLWEAREAVCICDFTATFELSQPTISHHMAKLRAAGLVEAEKRGIWVYYRLRQDLAGATVTLLEALLAGRSAEGSST